MSSLAKEMTEVKVAIESILLAVDRKARNEERIAIQKAVQEKMKNKIQNRDVLLKAVSDVIGERLGNYVEIRPMIQEAI